MARRIALAALSVLLTVLFGIPSAHADPAHTRADAHRAPGCATGTTAAGTISVCPGQASVGSTVTLSGTGCHNPGSRTVLAVFLGPNAHIGSAGGGAEINIPVSHDHFRTTFQIPATYPAADTSNTAAPVIPGPGYHFGVYPAGMCGVAFTVTGAPSLASTGPALPVAALVALAIALLLVGVLLTRRGRPRVHTLD